MTNIQFQIQPVSEVKIRDFFALKLFYSIYHLSHLAKFAPFVMSNCP